MPLCCNNFHLSNTLVYDILVSIGCNSVKCLLENVCMLTKAIFVQDICVSSTSLHIRSDVALAKTCSECLPVHPPLMQVQAGGEDREPRGTAGGRSAECCLYTWLINALNSWFTCSPTPPVGAVISVESNLWSLRRWTWLHLPNINISHCVHICVQPHRALAWLKTPD